MGSTRRGMVGKEQFKGGQVGMESNGQMSRWDQDWQMPFFKSQAHTWDGKDRWGKRCGRERDTDVKGI